MVEGAVSEAIQVALFLITESNYALLVNQIKETLIGGPELS